MRRSARMALALSLCALGAPAVPGASAQEAGGPDAPGVSPAVPAPTQAASPFTQDRASSRPTALVPNGVGTPFRYPEAPIVLSWGDVPGAVSYAVEVSDSPGFSRIVWRAETARPVAVPETLLPDGQYWWRVRATDRAGTVGIASEVARFAKTWPGQVASGAVAALPGGPPVSHVALNPYLSWTPVPGATTYEVQIAGGDQFASPVFAVTNVHAPFITPAVIGAIPDGSYRWRVRAKDPAGNYGPWWVSEPFTKGWDAPGGLAPADEAVSHSLMVSWQPVDGAEAYQVQMSDRANNFVGSALKVNATTAATAFVPTVSEQTAKGLAIGADVYWRVRPVLNGGTYGAWSAQRLLRWRDVGPVAAAPTLVSTGDSDSGLSPHLAWTRVAGAAIYRVDIATDPQFNNIVESEHTTSTGWASRAPLPDTQVGAGYHWRVVWGASPVDTDPDYMVDEAGVPRASFRKQTRVVLASGAGGAVVDAAPLLTWGSVPGIAKYEVQLSPDGRFEGGGLRAATIHGLGAAPGAMAEGEARLPDGTWSWRVRAIDGAGAGQTWSPAGQFTLNQPRPPQTAPNDGASVVYSPLLTWGPVMGACSYDVDVSRDPSFGGASEPASTAQTALVPATGVVTTPGVHYWRVRADYCDGVKGQWSPTRSFRSVFPPSLNLNSVPRRVDYRTRVIVAGQLRNNGAVVRQARLRLERRLWPGEEFRPAGTVRTNNAGRFRMGLRMIRSASYRLVWPESATNPQGMAAFSINVAPRVTFRLAAGRVPRKKALLVRGSVFPRRPAQIQVRTSDGWRTVRKLSPKRPRFAVRIGTHRLDPGRHRVRLWVPRDPQRKFVNVSSRQRNVLVFDRFVIRRGR